MCSLTFTGKLGGNLSRATKLEKLPGPSRNGPQANITSATEGLHSTWLIVNNRIRTEKNIGWGWPEKRMERVICFVSPVQGMDR